MTLTELQKLPIGHQVHQERPGPCRSLTVSAHRRNVSILEGGPIKTWRGDSLKLLHIPERCPFYVSPETVCNRVALGQPKTIRVWNDPEAERRRQDG